VISTLDALARPLLSRLDPERAHRLTLAVLAQLPLPPPRPDDPRLGVKALGLDFPNPIGLAAGFDKNAEVVDAALAMGFGFTEIGTVTPLPQDGNPRSRVFRLLHDRAVINRLGFPSEGHRQVHARLLRRRGRPGIVGVNLGANKDSEDRVADYVRGIEAFADVASYFTINVSSPNTPGLRDLQQAPALDDLLARVLATRDKAAEASGPKPVLLKIAPDLSLEELDEIISVVRKRNIDGLIVSNTTISRPPTLRDEARREAGGLSGRPLFDISTRLLAAAYLRVEKQFPLIGVGGIDSAEAAFAKIEAGASLLQLYTGLVTGGAKLIGEIERDLPRLLTEKAYPSLAVAVGARAADQARA
jgi:dihydroorotate dehydrogenase